MAQSFPVDNISEIFLSGCAEEILFLDEYLQTQLDVNVEYLNPLKNIAIDPDEEENFELSKPALTTALGAALNLDRSVNLSLICSKNLKNSALVINLVFQ